MADKANGSLLQKIQELAKLLRIPEARVVNEAIVWYAWTVEKINKGGAIYLEEDGKKYTVTPPFLNQKQ